MGAFPQRSLTDTCAALACRRCGQAVAKYLEQVGQQYPKGLPVLEVEKSAFVMPRRLDDHVDLEVGDKKLAIPPHAQGCGKRYLHDAIEMFQIVLLPSACWESKSFPYVLI